MKWYVSYRSGPIDPYSSSPKMAILYNSISTNIIDFFVISKYTALGLLLESLKSPVGDTSSGVFLLKCTTNAPQIFQVESVRLNGGNLPPLKVV